MDSQALIELGLKILSCNQNDLATKLKVSPTQISKWKKDEHMSSEMEEKLRSLMKIGDMDPSFVLTAGSLKDAKKWERLMHYLAERADEAAETGYNTYPLTDEELPRALLCGETFRTLTEMGIAIPKEFPKELDSKDQDSDEFWEMLEQNACAHVIHDIYKSLNDVYGFYAAYVDELINDDDLELTGTAAENIEPCLMALAASKIEVSEEIAPNLRGFRHKTREDYTEWLTLVKDRAFRAGVSLRAEIMDLVTGSQDELSHEAEAESLGFTAGRLHPDIYMNELLVGMRLIHQVLPAILTKLGISKEEFTLDTSKLSLD